MFSSNQYRPGVVNNTFLEAFLALRDGVQNTPQPLALTVVVADNRCFDS